MKVKGKKNKYVFTNVDMLEGVIIYKKDDTIKIKILKHKNKKNEGEVFWCCPVKDDEFEIIKETSKEKQQFSKKDLRVGDKVTRRDGQTYIYDGKWIGGLFCASINEDLTNAGTMKEAFDIVKVERAVEYEVVFERKEEILDETEKRYLAGVIRPFRDKVKHIKKQSECAGPEREFIEIYLSNDYASLPDFKKDTMYKGMKADRKYTLEELGL